MKHIFTHYGWSLLLLCTALASLLAGGIVFSATTHQPEPVVHIPAYLPVEAVEAPIQPIPLAILVDEEKVALGQQIFSDPILSGDGTISCATCHQLATGGADGLRTSQGINGAQGRVNAPSVYNSRFNFRQFWDGRAESLEDQMDGPINNPNEMGSSWGEVLEKLGATDHYPAAFNRIYADGITVDNVKDVLAEFQRSLTTPNSRFDRYLRGDTLALSADEIAGYNLFRNYGCASCHQGVNVGGNIYQRFGIMADYFADRGDITEADYGLYNVTGLEEDRYVFKVPSLRNVALTAPYFHDGAAETLEQAVETMGYYQLGRNLADAEISLIVRFLNTLTGEHPELNPSST